MWPIHVLVNKLLKAERPEEGHDLCLDETHNFKSLLRNGHSHFIQVPHIKQLRSWDCGLACVLMVLRTLGLNHYDLQDLEEICRTTSIWTVDLAYLLQKLSISFSYFTVTLGANPDFSVENFYKEQLANDIGRVDMLFQRSVEEGIKIEVQPLVRKYEVLQIDLCCKVMWILLSVTTYSILAEPYMFKIIKGISPCQQRRSIKGEEIVFLILSGKYIVIALVDQCILSHPWKEDVSTPRFYTGTAAYTGHYVVICGYDAHADEFEIRDPASSRKSDRISSKCLEQARKSYGTDEDILLISLVNTGN